MKFKYDNGGWRTDSGLAQNCTVRAISIMFDKEYELAHKELQFIAKTVFKKELDIKDGCPAQVTECFMRFNKWRFLSVRDSDGIPLLRLKAEDMPTNNCFPVIHRHITVIKDGNNRDIVNHRNRAVLGIYVDDRHLPQILNFKAWPALGRVWDDVHVMSPEEGKRYYREHGFIMPSNRE